MTWHQGRPTRRDILTHLPAAAAFLAVHEALGQAAAPKSTPVAIPRGVQAAPRIQALRLLTSVPLADMRKFYQDKLGLEVAGESATELALRAGATRLTLVKAAPEQIKGNGGRGNGEPMYHFAFNIPCNKIRGARDWQLKRTPLVEPRADNRDSNFPSDVWHFRHWSAHSVFFFDPAWNIVEYIARHDLKNESGKDDQFEAKDILYASEIGYVTDRIDQKKTVALMRDKLGLSEYPRGAEPWAMGDERGLLLCLARVGQQWAEHTKTPVNWGVFPTECTISGPMAGEYKVDGFPYLVRAE